MAAVYSPTLSNVHSPLAGQHNAQLSPSRRPQVSKQRFVTDLSQCLFDFVVQLLPTQEELAIKEDVRKLLERLIRTIEPDSRLLSFGSTANGFSLRNSDMDLCCLIDSEERLPATDLVNMLGDLFARETKFRIKPLPHARIPIVKLSLDPTPGLPLGIACDIGFENRLALENTRLLMCYAMIDPARVRTLVLFLKIWCKRRKINSPYKGTLSSYGYVLLVIYFLVHVKNPPVLPNLQQMPPLRPISPEETHLNEYNIWFFDDINLLRERWQSSNTETVAELLIDFFKFYSRDFAYNTGVASIRAGLLSKESKGWDNDPDRGTARERNRLCIEDPFETNFNVARCVTRDGLYTIRGEFMRASRILAARPERAVVALAQLCEERKDEELLHASPSRTYFQPPRLSSVPQAAQTPYTIGSNPMRPVAAPEPDRLSPPEMHHIPASIPSSVPPQQPEHMAPKRAKWTSPPPPEAPEEDRSAFEDRLGHGLMLATASTDAREIDYETASSSNNSEILTDEDDRRSTADSDDVLSVRSFTEGGSHYRYVPQPTFHSPQMRSYVPDPSSSRAIPRYQQAQFDAIPLDHQRLLARLRGRPAIKTSQYLTEPGMSYQSQPHSRQEASFVQPPRMDNTTPRRSMSGPARSINRFSMSALPAVVTPLSVYPSRTQTVNQAAQQQQQRSNVFYETSSPIRDRMVRALSTNYAMPIARLPAYGLSPQEELSPQHFGGQGVSPRHIQPLADRIPGPSPPLSTTPSQTTISSRTSHAHSHSQSTITAPTPPPTSSNTRLAAASKGSKTSSRSRSRSSDKRPRRGKPSSNAAVRSASPYTTTSSNSASPAMSCASSQYAPSPVSTSPPSPIQSETIAPSTLSPIQEKKSPISASPTAQKALPSVEEHPRIAVVDAEAIDLLIPATKALSVTQ